jgi:hypothetical protein
MLKQKVISDLDSLSVRMYKALLTLFVLMLERTTVRSIVDEFLVYTDLTAA